MPQRGRLVTRRRFGSYLPVLLLLILATGSLQPARATVRYGDVELSGSFDTQNLARVGRIDNWQFIQNRNTMLLRMDWELLKNGSLVNRYNFPFLKRTKLFLLYRGVYDGFYSIAPGDRQKGVSRADDIIGGPIEGNNRGTCRDPVTGDKMRGVSCTPNDVLREGLYSRYSSRNRRAVAYENVLREAYFDVSLTDAPLSFRLGRQQIIWGESDQFRMMDIVNPLDLTWHLQQEPFERLRIPQWIVKGLYDMGVWDAPLVGPLSNMFVEAFWNPFDYYPGAKNDFLPRPWAAPIANPVRQGAVQVDPAVGAIFSPTINLEGTSFAKGDFNKTPGEASSTGARFHAIMDNGLEFTANYIYARGRTIGALAGTPYGLKIRSITANLTREDPSLGQFDGLPMGSAQVDAQFIHPYSNIFGATANYSDEDFTQTVYRLETAYALGQPVQTAALNKRVQVYDSAGTAITGLHAPLGFDKRDVWAGMLGFDRPTWIRPLNPRTTFFITGQFFWSYISDDVNNLRGPIITGRESPYFRPAANQFPALNQSDGFGQWTSGPFAGISERTQNARAIGSSDNIEHFELLTTLAAFTFYKGGSVMPFAAIAVDPVNVNFLSQLSLDYLYTPNFIIQLQAKFFTDFDRGLSLDPWGVGGLNHRRSEIGAKFTFQF